MVSRAVIKLENSERELKKLCKEMLATLTLEKNAEVIPELLVPVIEGWQKRFYRILEDV